MQSIQIADIINLTIIENQQQENSSSLKELRFLIIVYLKYIVI